MKTAVFIYEASQVESLPALLLKWGSEAEVVAFGADIEFLLDERNISYRSVKKYRSISTPERLELREKLGRELLQHESFSFFTHRGIRLGTLFTPALQYYLENFLYYLDIVGNLLQEPYERVVLLGTIPHASPTSGILEGLSSRILPDVVALVCKNKNIAVETDSLFLGEKSTLKEKIRQGVFNLKRALFGYLLHTCNALVRVFAAKKKIRILGSEYWKNISALMPELPDSELTLLDRSEAFKIGLKNILKHRVQFMHVEDFTTGRSRRLAHSRAHEFREGWKKIKDTHPILQESFHGYALRSAFIPALERIIASGEKAVREIEGTFSMMEKLAPQVVIVRASISAQTHFAILCEVARLLDIPSIEIQHGIFSMSRQILTWDHAAEYIAGYGPLDAALWKESGYAPHSTPIPVGSPRFDAYVSQDAALPTQDQIFKVVLIGPQVRAGDWIDTYDAIDHFSIMAQALAGIPDAHVIIKLRAGDGKKLFFKQAIMNAFKGISYEVISEEPLVAILSKADAVISCHSTAALEALLVDRSVILDAIIPIHALLVPKDFSAHEKAGAVLIAHTPQELETELQSLSRDPKEREAQSQRAEEFMRENYLFSDGKSSKRLADSIRSLIE